MKKKKKVTVNTVINAEDWLCTYQYTCTGMFIHKVAAAWSAINCKQHDKTTSQNNVFLHKFRATWKNFSILKYAVPLLLPLSYCCPIRTNSSCLLTHACSLTAAHSRLLIHSCSLFSFGSSYTMMYVVIKTPSSVAYSFCTNSSFTGDIPRMILYRLKFYNESVTPPAPTPYPYLKIQISFYNNIGLKLLFSHYMIILIFARELIPHLYE